MAPHSTRPGTGQTGVRPPLIATADETNLVDASACAELVRRAGVLECAVARGVAVDSLAEQASNLFVDLQGRLLTHPTATHLQQILARSLDGLRASTAYTQETVVPPFQSQAEGQLARCLDLLDIAARWGGKGTGES